jgi:hypothetical protein
MCDLSTHTTVLPYVLAVLQCTALADGCCVPKKIVRPDYWLIIDAGVSRQPGSRVCIIERFVSVSKMCTGTEVTSLRQTQ